MKIIPSKSYNRDYRKIIINKHLVKEAERIENIRNLILDSPNMKDLMLNPFSNVYGIEKKDGNLKEIYTADVNKKIRLQLKPIGEYPYKLDEIVEIEFLKIDDKHYGDG